MPFAISLVKPLRSFADAQDDKHFSHDMGHGCFLCYNGFVGSCEVHNREGGVQFKIVFLK